MRGIDCTFSFLNREKRWSRMLRLPSIPVPGMHVEVTPTVLAARIVNAAVLFHRIENLKKVNPLIYVEMVPQDVDPADLEKWGWKCEP